jgi:hypothetical protein
MASDWPASPRPCHWQTGWCHDKTYEALADTYYGRLCVIACILSSAQSSAQKCSGSAAHCSSGTARSVACMTYALVTKCGKLLALLL